MLRRPASPHLAGLCPCARTRDVIWGRWFNAPGVVLLSQARCTSLGCPATVAAVTAGIQTGHCKCQQALSSLPRHPTSCCGKAPCLDAVLQVLWCLSAVSPSPPFGAAPWPADRSYSPWGTQGFVLVPGGAARAGDVSWRQCCCCCCCWKGSTLSWDQQRDCWANRGEPWPLFTFLLCLECPLSARGLLVRSWYPITFTTPLK